MIHLLCDKHEGLLLEAKGIKEHWWKPYIKKLFDKRMLRGKAENLSGILDIGNYEANNKAVNQLYEEYVLSYGDFDERIFLLAEADIEIGTPAKYGGDGMGELSQQVRAVRNLRQHFDETTSLAPSTPLTGRRYLKQKDEHITPVSTATQSVSRLQSMLSGSKTSPSDHLISIFKSCSRNPLEDIQQRVAHMGETFCTKYAQPTDVHMGSHIDFARKRLQLGESLYYKALENIVQNEKKRVEHSAVQTDFSNLLEQDIFHRSLFACCLEIVIFSYNAQRVFPWIVDVFGLSTYHFYKVIEVLIRAEENLSRDVVKHLNHIEELILDSLVWKSSSPLWEAIQNHKVPSVEEVSLPNQIEQECGSVVSTSSIGGISQTQVFVSSPLAHPALRRVVGTDRGGSPNPKTNKVDPIQSPTGGALDLFNSPAPGNAKRKLFTAVPGDSTTVKALVGAEEGTRSVTVFKTEDGKQLLVPVKVKPGAQTTSASLLTPVRDGVKEEKAGDEKTKTGRPKMSSLFLFFRKVYHLASVRLRDLCERLDVDSRLRSQMWTCFEHTVMEHPSLLMDRHLDQVIMCCVYVMAKVTQKDRSFQDIMRCYRLQPQAQSHVYRSVLLVGRRRHSSGESSHSSKNDEASSSSSPVNLPTDDKKQTEKVAMIRSTSTLPGATPGSQPPTPTPTSNAAAGFDFDENPEDRGDLIKFYNKVFVNKTKGFALKFSSHNQEKKSDTPLLSPLPAVRSHPSSPRRRVSTKHAVYVSPHKCHTPTLTPQSKLLYCFSRSPAKDLQAINNMLTMRELSAPRSVGIKRLLQDDDISDSKKLCLGSSPVINTRLEELVAQRASGGAR